MSIAKTRRALQFTTVKNVTELGNYTVVNETVVNVIKAAANQAATFITLPPTPTSGRTVFIKDAKGDGAANNITAVGTIDGAANYVIAENYGAVGIQYDGAAWGVVFQGKAVSSAELAFLNGVTAGTVTASKAVVVDASSDANGLGNLTMTGTLRMSSVGTIAAAGTVVANATAIGANAVANVTNDTDAKGVVLPAGSPGEMRTVINHSANTVQLYGPAGGTLRGNAANTATPILTKAQAVCICVAANVWGATIS